MRLRLLVSSIVGLAAFTATLVATQPAPAAPNLSPLVIIFMENHERSSIVGSSSADYLNAFRTAGRDFTHYYGVAHPSLPNYLAVGNGSTNGKVGSDSITAGEIPGPTLWRQLSRQRIPWGVYMEDMPSVCYGGTSSGGYVLRHNPATPFASVYSKPNRCANVKPYSSFDVTALPAVSFISPNLCNDMHDCSIATGDNWLAARVPAMLSAGAEVFITFDEGSTSTGGGGNIYAALRGPGIGASVNTATFSHYSLLAAIEMRLGVKRLNNAATAPVLPI